MARPFFENDRLSDLETFERHLQRLLEILEDRARTGEPLDLQVRQFLKGNQRRYLIYSRISMLAILLTLLPTFLWDLQPTLWRTSSIIQLILNKKLSSKRSMT